MKMKKVLSICLALLMTGSIAGAEEISFDQVEGVEWTFSSGAGAWSTDLRIKADGSFSGEFHDSEMGEASEEYPNGTVYYSSFTGQMSLGEQVDAYSREVRIDSLTVDASQEQETIADGIRFVTYEPYGISEGDVMLLYQPETPVSVLTDDMKIWAHLMDVDDTSAEMGEWFLYSEKNESGFAGYLAEDGTGIANPWTEMTEEELQQTCGIPFGLPDGAENVICRWLESENLAEIQFTIDSDEYCARIQPAALQGDELSNISGIYYAWENEEKINIGHCNGTRAQAQADSDDWVELCLWYDAAPGIMYSLSVVTTELDGLDLVAVARQVYIPVQGDN